MQSEFGITNWKSKVAEYVSWAGLEGTDDFMQWATANNLNPSVDSNGNVIYPYYQTIVTVIKGTGVSNCEE